ncbi:MULTISPECIES: lasso peptide biosynthesis B2 protein [unclassified Undibacterium]|uniref:lasso peptide biosynthesis B2 protein n=1 Tax=unclassified Undibacterium TaxID=2630295 RepID=UPI002AC9B85C|nr:MULTISPECIES: lasso peptide biosynthesis B2 protein [unclassified Undibacterium]MEB0140916.1 lasso peptide biosynthesis B2 protein [Undibacterium sp. CCC2.1]MEB0173892.1 lasso peptide biosynthesis B2 protein [Undibacterium sp. CCC1.1]MEB0177887.1 lasso peptide biosynthesis B2 protein [Undibacterium sp. CCC3.4]MEB0217091.1 lasso peptide biosynthesis B2 protein [Undibacterium sp. 5I2]WPX42126.1 lasso peptide biosynthesis B2 protein [Undibacterium sp. CCC3.4]
MSLAARKLRNFLRQPRFFQLGFFPTWCLLGLARMVVLSVPFRQIAPRLGQHAGVNAAVPLLTPAAIFRARQISHLINGSARYCPWNANCFAQAITARCWLKVYGIPYALYFGLKKDAEQKLLAHAWVCAGPVYVTGGNSFSEFTVVSMFLSPALWAR